MPTMQGLTAAARQLIGENIWRKFNDVEHPFLSAQNVQMEVGSVMA